MSRTLRSLATAAFLTLAAGPVPAFANTGVFLGAGTRVVPITSTEVQLVRERVVMRLVQPPGTKLLEAAVRADVEALFELRNTSASKVDIQGGLSVCIAGLGHCQPYRP